MKCFQCNKEIKNEIHMVVTPPDGDCFCDQKCYDDYKKEREHFFKVVVHDDKLLHDWLRS